MAGDDTPMMRQYRQIRSELPEDTILFFRLGDFYEMFFDDAKRAAEVLDIALTKRHKVPMCGIPYHASEGYLARMLRAGLKVAICEQVEDPAQAKGIVKREVTQVITPGTIVEEQVLDAHQNNFLAGLTLQNGCYGLALLDLSTGTFWMEESDTPGAVYDNLARYRPSECVIPEESIDDPGLTELIRNAAGCLLTAHDDWTFEREFAHDLLIRHFQVRTLDGFGAEAATAGLGAAGAVMHYVTQNLRRKVDHVRRLVLRNPQDYMVLDESTIANLDLVESRSNAPGAKASTVLRAMDGCRTAMGSRLLRDWLLRPLNDQPRIVARHEAVQSMIEDRPRLRVLQEQLAVIRDIERLVARIHSGSGTPRDVRAVGHSLMALPPLKTVLMESASVRMQELGAAVSLLPELCAWIDRALVDEPPALMKNGGVMREGYHDELDELRVAASQGRQWLADFQVREQERTGIKSLKVRYNKVFGYYIEVTKANSGDVPEDYIRKQTLVNAERYITPELKEYENKILGAQDRAVILEGALFQEVREGVAKELESLQGTAAAVAEADVLTGFAGLALERDYVRPTMDDSLDLVIRDGRHPVIEKLGEGERFIPNDVALNGTDQQLIIITGPNMAGKSTYIRQVALLVILAQAGAYIPASEARIGLVDRVFTRVGASDDLARGRSTFMVEMHETANILNNATLRSLVVLDEIGRGTSTFDGISIAWSVAEHLHNTPEVKARTLFATHYHELTDLSRTMHGVKNFSVLVREKNNKIVFLRKIVPGAADKSYGIQVAQLAGLPEGVVQRAREILNNLEEGEFTDKGQPKLAKKRGKRGGDPDAQMVMFDLFPEG